MRRSVSRLEKTLEREPSADMALTSIEILEPPALKHEPSVAMALTPTETLESPALERKQSAVMALISTKTLEPPNPQVRTLRRHGIDANRNWNSFSFEKMA